MYKTENQICTITCDRCGKQQTADEKTAGEVFFKAGWGLFPNAKKYVHLCSEHKEQELKRRDTRKYVKWVEEMSKTNKEYEVIAYVTLEFGAEGETVQEALASYKEAIYPKATLDDMLKTIAINGLAPVLLQKYNEIRLHPFFGGKAEYTHFDVAGNPNPNHIFFKVHKMIDLMPHVAREDGPWVVAISENDYFEFDKFGQNVIRTSPNYQKAGSAWTRKGFEIKGHPNLKDGAIVIYQPRWIVQGYECSWEV